MKLQVFSFVALIAASLFQPAFSKTVTSQAGKVVSINPSSNGFTLSTTAPFINPAGCANTDFYEAASNSAEYKANLSIATNALSTKSRVTVIVSGTDCVESRPSIVSVFVLGN